MHSNVDCNCFCVHMPNQTYKHITNIHIHIFCTLFQSSSIGLTSSNLYVKPTDPLEQPASPTRQ